MQAVAVQRAGQLGGQPEFGEHLGVTDEDLRHPAVGRSVVDAAAAVDGVALVSGDAVGAARLVQGGQVQACLFGGADGYDPALAAYHGGAAGGGQHPVAGAVCAGRVQLYAGVERFGAGDRAQPHDVAQAGLGGLSGGGGTGQFEVRDTGQHRGARNDMVGDEEPGRAGAGPQLLASERVARQRHRRDAGAAQQAPGVDGVTLAIEVGQLVQGLDAADGVTGCGPLGQVGAALGGFGVRGAALGHDAAGGAGCRAQQPGRFVEGGGDQGVPVGEVVPALQQGGADPGEVRDGRAGEVGEQVADPLPQGLLGARREHQQVRGCVHRGRGGLGVVLDNEVGVGAAHAERAERGAPGPLGILWPAAVGLVDEERAGRPVDVVALLLAVQAGRDGVVVQGLDRGDQVDDAGGGQGVPEAGFDGGQRAELAAVGVPAERLGERGDLDGVSQPGAGAVGQHQVDAGGVDAVALVGAGEQVRLGGGVGGGDAVGAAVVVDAAAADDGVDAVAVGHGGGQALEHDHGYGFAEHHAVGTLVEGVAGAIG